MTGPDEKAQEPSKVPLRHFTFDDGLKFVFRSDDARNKAQREQLYREYLYHAVRHDRAIDPSIPEADANTINKRIEEDRRNGFSEFVLADVQEWWMAKTSRSRSASGQKGGLASGLSRQRKKI